MTAVRQAARRPFSQWISSLIRRESGTPSAAPPPPQPEVNAELRDYVMSFCSDSDAERDYALVHLGRFLRTLEITPWGTETDRILEMGSYLQITPAFQTKLGYGEVRGSYLGPAGKVDEKTVTSTSGETFRCLIDLFNAESDPYPYPDGHFTTVVCCELIEHLSEDPMHLMAEVNRITREGGWLVLSTPNTASLRSVAGVLKRGHPGLFTEYTKLKGGNATDPRHAREYTPDEVVLLLDASGFTMSHIETGSIGLERPTKHDWTLELLNRHELPTDLRDDVIHVVGRKSGPVKNRYPEWLYVR